MKTKPTIRGIANAAGVTPATVSYVLNQNARQTISAQTRERVLAAAREMGYLPSAAAKVVRGSPSCCVGVAIEKDLNTSRFNLVLQGIRDQMEQRGYNLMLCGFDRRHSIYPDYIRNTLEGRIDGVIFIGKDNEGPSAQAEALVLRHQIPFVVYDCGLEGKPYSTVELEYEQSSFEAAYSLLEQGVETVYYVRPSLDNYQETQREAGVVKAVERFHGRRLTVLRAPITQETMFDPERYPDQSEVLYIAKLLEPYLEETVLPLLRTCPPRSALILSWGVFVDPVWEFLGRAGCEVRLAALSNVFVSPLLREKVVCCRLPGYHAGEECARLLLKQLDGDRAPEQVMISLPIR